MDFNYSNKSLELQESLLKFFDEHIYPNEIDYDKAIEESGDPLHIPSVLEDLKEEAKKNKPLESIFTRRKPRSRSF